MADAPVSTYRVQLHAGFTFRDAAAQVPYLANLGITHVYLSPLMRAAPGSSHGYDVINPALLNEELGGEAGFGELRAALDAAGMSAIADVVPNHMTLPTPANLNLPWWQVLLHGDGSGFARWFDVDWAAGPIVLPVLGSPLAECLDRDEIRLDLAVEQRPVLRYFDHVFPVRAGTEPLPLPQLLAAQHYRLAYWRTGNEELNYRRFFDVSTLAGIRVEDDEVFASAHSRVLGLVADGSLTGLRIDHPDGLADPGGYVRKLAEASGGTWVVVEKILEGEERLPADWPCAGTTGYDAAARLGGLFTDPDGIPALTDLYTTLTGAPDTFAPVREQGKRDAVTRLLVAEVSRLVDILDRIRRADPLLTDHSRPALRQALVELLVAFPVYRAYVTPGQQASTESTHLLDEAVETARQRLPEHRHATLQLLRDLALGRRGRSADLDDFVIRFQQTCGPAMAKGVEDTAFYRWFRLVSANEVGGDPERPATTPEQYLSWCAAQQQSQPTGMTSLTTHDTKRSEDVRARLAVLSELPQEWAALVRQCRALTAGYRPAELDGNTEYLLWQTLLGAWPIEADRLTAYLGKASREAKRHTTWTEPVAAYDEALASFARRVLAEDQVRMAVGDFVEGIASFTRANVLGQKLLQLLQPGVPDVYQGTELGAWSLVDPDNRRSVDYRRRAALLADLDAGKAPAGLDAEKLHVVRTALRVRRDRVSALSGFNPVPTTSPHALAFSRSGEVVPVITRLAAGLERGGGWGDASLELPAGDWLDALSGRPARGGRVRMADVLGDLPVALLVRRA